MKKLMLSAAIVAAIVSFAQQPQIQQVQRKPLTPEERAARAERIKFSLMKNQGGFVCDRREQTGFIAVVNGQKKVEKEAFAKAIRSAGYALKIDIKLVDGEPVTLDTADKAFADTKANLAVFVVEDAKLPGVFVAPENRWAFVNVAKYAGEKQGERVRKEILRAICLVCGSGYSAGSASLMTPIARQEQLDYITRNDLPFDQIGMMQNHIKQFGITTYIQTTYREACRLGWAPAPTNEWQKAIFEEVKSKKERGPANGLTIQPPKK